LYGVLIPLLYHRAALTRNAAGLLSFNRPWR